MKPSQEKGEHGACIKTGQCDPKGFPGRDLGATATDTRRRGLLLSPTHGKRQVSLNRYDEEPWWHVPVTGALSWT